MACGKAMVLASTGGSADVAKGAALFSESRNVDEFAKNMLNVLLNERIKTDLENRSLERSKLFRWEKSASLCIEALKRCVHKRNLTSL
jgi:glycosyltransferase involved in cell wall biosynthesis